MDKILHIIPAYNEEESIERVINNLEKNFPQYDYVIVNDGSKDKTEQVCVDNGYNIISLPIHLGLAGGFQAGMKYAKQYGYDYAVQFDADGQHLPEYIERMLNLLKKEDDDIVIGSRFVKEKMNHSARMMGNRLINMCIKITSGKRIYDSTSGMRMFNRKMIKILADTPNMGPEPDTICYCIRSGAKIGECQVKMQERLAGQSYLSFFKSIRYMITMSISILIIQWFRKGNM